MKLIIFILMIVIILLLIKLKKMKKSEKVLGNRLLQRTQELEKKETLFKYLFDNTIEGILVFEEGKCVDINNAGIKLLNFNSKKEALKIDRSNFIADDSKKIVQEHLKLQRTTPYEINAIKADGAMFPALVTGRDAKISDKSFRITCFIDLSSLKEKEKELEIKTEYLNRFYNNNGIGILLVDKNRMVTKINEKLAKLWGYEPHDLIGKSAETFHISKESYEKFGKIAFEQTLYKHKIDIEYKFKRKDGSLFWAKFSGEKINRDDVLWIITDIDQLKVKEKDLEKQKEDFKQLFDTAIEKTSLLDVLFKSIPVPIFYKNADGVYLGTNEEFEKIYGFEKNFLIGKTVFDIAPFDIAKKYHAQDEELFHNPDQKQIYTHVIKNMKTGQFHEVIFHKQCYMDKENNVLGIIGAIMDVTKINKIQKELLEAKQKAEESTKSKSEFLANMSHEIRTPMNGIIGMSFLALQTPLNEKQKKYLLNIENSAKNLLNIINDILDFSKIEAGKLTIEKTNFNMKELLESIQTLLWKKASEKNLSLSIKHSCSQDHICFGDSLRISQILINLIGNAIKFTSKGSIEVHVRRLDDNRARFEVKDTGIGISPEQQSKLFQSFAQADGSTTRKYGGTGLGLSISKQLVELMNGKIWIESEPDIGSNFIFEIELAKGDISKIKTRETRDLNIQNLRGSNILLVDDNVLNQEIIIGLLENSGINIDIASNGEAALEMFEKNSYELILMDLQMPILSGLEAAKIMRETDSIIPIIALTANITKENIEATKRAGMNEYLSKPIEIEKLYEILVKYLPKKAKLSTNTKEEEREERRFQTFIHIDTKIGLSHMADNKKLYLKILNDFYTNYKDLQLQEFNNDEFKRMIHTIKGLSANIGAVELSNISKKLEKTFDEELFQEFYIQLYNVLDELKELQQDSKMKTLIKLDTHTKVELFSQLKEYAHKRRARECKRILEEFSRYSLSKEDQKLLDRIKDYLNERNYHSVLGLL